MISHPFCGHDVSFGPDSHDVDCCICVGNPCADVTVDLMARHRDFDLDLWSRREVVGHVAPF